MAQQAAKEKLDSFLPSMVKGKQREDHPEQRMRIGLWRAISGVHVWDADVAGSSIIDMAWSLDGMHLWNFSYCQDVDSRVMQACTFHWLCAFPTATGRMNPASD